MKPLKTFEIKDLVNYTVNGIVKDKKFHKLEKAAINARLATITATNKKNPTQRQVLEVVYKELGVQNI